MAEEIVISEYSDVMQKSYIDYAMSVICSRAVPDVRDGLKPVQRRVLYAMSQLGLRPDRPHRKSARIVGDTMGKYHPHGDSSIYETLVVMEQEFKKEMPLVDGHGNFGSIEGDGAAAMRYTEARLEKFTQDVYLADLDKNVVDFVPNFDETEKEPSVLPVKIPNILVNGAEGIAVGMTTNIPTHNLDEIINAEIAYLKNSSITTEELMELVPGPDFPTGGIVTNKSELKNIYETGNGKIKLRGKVVFEPATKKGGRDRLVITEIPYTMIGANIGKFILDICDLVESKKTQDIVDVSNESSKEGIRIVLELKKGADPKNIENLLYKKTKLEDTFGVNMLAIVDGKPEVLGLKQIISHCANFQFEINTRKYRTLLARDNEQKEIKEGLIKACDIIDLIIEIIRGSASLSQAKACLINGITKDIRFKSKASEKEASKLCFTELQAQAILDLKLSKLIGLEIIQLKADYDELVKKIAEYEKILSDKNAMKKVIIKDLEAIKKEYGFERKTLICDAEEAVVEEVKVKEQEVVFLMDRFGYAKLIDPAAYDKNTQIIDAENKYVLRCMNTDTICVFTQTGTMHSVKVLKIPTKKPKDKGVPIDNICNYTSTNENIVQVSSMGQLKFKKMLFTTKEGMIKFVDGGEFDVSKRTVSATKLDKDDEVVSIEMIDYSSQKLYGGAGDFYEDDDRPAGIYGGSTEVTQVKAYSPAAGNVPEAEVSANGLNALGQKQNGQNDKVGPDDAEDVWKVGEDAGFTITDDEDDQFAFEFIDITSGSISDILDNFRGKSGEDRAGVSGADAAEENAGLSEPDAEGSSVSDAAGGYAGVSGADAAVFTSNKMAVIQTRNGSFLRFKLNEVPELKKNARGVKGIKLSDGDEVDKVYIVGYADAASIDYHGKHIELMKIKLAKRGGKGVRPRVGS